MVTDPEEPDTLTWLEVPESCVTPLLVMAPAEMLIPVPAVSLAPNVVALVTSAK